MFEGMVVVSCGEGIEGAAIMFDGEGLGGGGGRGGCGPNIY